MNLEILWSLGNKDHDDMDEAGSRPQSPGVAKALLVVIVPVSLVVHGHNIHSNVILLVRI